MTITDRIQVNPRVTLGKPVILGTHVPVELLLRKLSEGASETDLLERTWPHARRHSRHNVARHAGDRNPYRLCIDRVVVISPSTEPAAGTVKSRWQIQ
jgi:hypothetical protein